MNDIYEKRKDKKLKGYKYFKNKRRNNVTIVYSDPLTKPDDIIMSDHEEYELGSQDSNESPRKKNTNYKLFKIDKVKVKNTKSYPVPIITRAYSRVLYKKSFDDQSELFN